MSLDVVGIVLAGGASRRMGTAKAGLRYGGRSFLAHVLTALAGGGVADVVVVAGTHRDAVAAALPPGSAVAVLRNPAPERGQLSSLKVALDHVRQTYPDADAVLVALVDHPAVRATTVAALLAAASAVAGSAIVLPTHAGRRGHPVLFRRSLWQELSDASEEAGARVVVRADPRRVREVVVDDPGILVDVDTPEDFRRLLDEQPRDGRR